MSKPRKKHSVESLLSRTVEVGDCLEWTGYYGNGVPYVCHEGSMTSVRRLLRVLDGQDAPAGYYATTCENPKCVHPDHIIFRTQKKHMARMGKRNVTTPAKSQKIRQAHIKAGRTVLDEYKAQEIRLSDEPGPVLAAKYGVSKSTIAKIRSGEAWRLFISPFRGLFK